MRRADTESPALAAALSALLGEPAVVHGAVYGGDINRAVQGQTASGRRFFAKTHPAPPAGMFEAEAAGLSALRRGGCRVPEVLAQSPTLLVLEWITPGPTGPRFLRDLGRGLAQTHQLTRPTFGFDGDNFVGLTPQPNPDEPSWPVFFAQHRLQVQHRRLRAQGRCPERLSAALDRIVARIPDRLPLPADRPALLHGDLWTGNAMADASGRAVIYDPAAYFGAPEADLAMTELFGGFGDGFFAAYTEIAPIAPDYPTRRDLYNLYHLLNHANLFGGGYIKQAEAIAVRYC